MGYPATLLWSTLRPYEDHYITCAAFAAILQAAAVYAEAVRVAAGKARADSQ